MEDKALTYTKMKLNFLVSEVSKEIIVIDMRAYQPNDRSLCN